MWILPKQLHTSDFVPDTAALSLDSTELSEICARSLFVRSKPSPARTWSAKWKRDSWTQHLSGRILNPSHGQSFVTAWTSSLGAIPANPSAQPESASAQTTLATSGHLSQTEFGFCDLDSASLRMSKDTSALASEKSLESWNQSVTKRRGEYSVRVKSAHRIRGSGSSSWPTIRASEYKDTGPIGSKSHDHMLGKGYLCAVVTQDAWQTPTTNMDMVRSEEGVQKRIAFRASIGRKSIPDGNLGEQMQRVVKDAANWPTPAEQDGKQGGITPFQAKGGNHTNLLHIAAIKSTHGQAAPANPSTDGSRQGLWVDWRTPQANEAGARVETLYTKDGQPARPGERAYRKTPDGRMVLQSQTINQQVEMVNRQGLWPTITAHTPDMESNGPNGNSGTYLAGAVKAEENWVTPRTSGTSTRPNKTTPRQGLTLIEQAREQAQYGTPTARDHKSGRGNEEREYKELTPMVERQQAGKLNPRWVETLMGLPVGWTMPSCKSPVTIALTNFASSETESCLQQPSELLES